MDPPKLLDIFHGEAGKVQLHAHLLGRHASEREALQ
jgi:hypothetical protein